LIDTNSIIDYLDDKLPNISSVLIDKNVPQISVISRMELLAWPNATKEQLEILTQFVNTSVVFSLDEPVILKAIELRKGYRIKLPDAIIAATALVHSLDLITRNIDDFKSITGLKAFNPYEV